MTMRKDYCNNGGNNVDKIAMVKNHIQDVKGVMVERAMWWKNVNG
jgi:hypothetical protein